MSEGGSGGPRGRMSLPDRPAFSEHFLELYACELFRADPRSGWLDDMPAGERAALLAYAAVRLQMG